MRFSIQFLAIVAAVSVSVWELRAQDTENYESPPINYSHSQPHDIVTQLRAKFASGELKFGGNDRQVMRQLLRMLRIPVESQLLVFSKTSFQNDRISPDHPRALYYTGNCYVGWVPGGLVEITAIDPKLGPIFYSFEPRTLAANPRPEFNRMSDCLRCHGGNFVAGIPGVFARSVFPDKDGEPLLRQGTEVVDYRTPFSERWGGWYVTGLHGKTVHRGNILASENAGQLIFNPAAGANVTNLSRFFDTDLYLTNSSDIVALMVFEHQTAMQNALTQAGMNCRRMLDYRKQLEKVLKDPAKGDDLHYDSVRGVFDHSAELVLDALLFKDEATLPDEIIGSPAFQKAFAADAPRARDGSSLKDFMLSDHLFKNRCSYMIYSDAFLSLPKPLKSRIYARLGKALDLDHPDIRYTYIHYSERKRIAEILRETHEEFRESEPKHRTSNTEHRIEEGYQR